MPRSLQKSLQDYISKIKKPTIPKIQSISSSKNWILATCKHPKTPSFAFNRGQNDDHNKSFNKDDAATLSDIGQFLFDNFKSLYVTDDDEYYHDNRSHDEDVDIQRHRLNEVSFESPKSRPFFVVPSQSSLIMEEATTSDEDGSTTIPNNMLHDSVQESKDAVLPEDCIAIVTYSQSPYDDFRGSMQDMVEAKLRQNGRVDWDFMEEILSCYLKLNDKKSHKFILNAFVDLIVVLRQNSSDVGGKSRRTSRSPQNARERRRKMR